jgi:hypothetical protein
MKKEKPFSELEQFLPANTYPQVIPYFKNHTIHLTLTEERKSILGDYRRPVPDQPFHRISINATLNPYSFLITLLHELAHMLVFIRYKDKVLPHGKEWKLQFREMLLPYLGKHFFPPDIEAALTNYLNNPKASTCTDTALYKALYRYSHTKAGYKLVEDIGINNNFGLEDGTEYVVIEKRRTRYRCKQLKTGKMYLFPAIYEVKAI